MDIIYLRRGERVGCNKRPITSGETDLLQVDYLIDAAFPGRNKYVECRVVVKARSIFRRFIESREPLYIYSCSLIESTRGVTEESYSHFKLEYARMNRIMFNDTYQIGIFLFYYFKFCYVVK